MSYDVHFLRREPGQDWLDALEDEERRASWRRPEPGDAMRREWWRTATRVYHELVGGQLRQRGSGLRFVQRDVGLQLDLGRDGVTLSLAYVHDEQGAHGALGAARRVAAAVTKETSLEAYDPQLDEPFLCRPESLLSAARIMAATRVELLRPVEGALAAAAAPAATQAAWGLASLAHDPRR